MNLEHLHETAISEWMNENQPHDTLIILALDQKTGNQLMFSNGDQSVAEYMLYNLISKMDSDIVQSLTEKLQVLTTTNAEEIRNKESETQSEE